MNRILCLTCLTFLMFISFISVGDAQTIDDLILMTEEFPPYNFIEDGKLQGTSVDLMVLILEKMNSGQTRKDIRVLTWARSYKMVSEEKNTVLFVMTRTEERENLFKWVGPISTARNVLMAKKVKNIKISSADDVKKYKVGVVRDDAGEQLVIDRIGIKKEDLDITSRGELNIKKLNADRMSLIAYDENVAKWLIKKEGFNTEDFETVYVLQEGSHYFAFHKDTPDSLIMKIQSVLDEIKKEGEYDRILEKYLK